MLTLLSPLSDIAGIKMSVSSGATVDWTSVAVALTAIYGAFMSTLALLLGRRAPKPIFVLQRFRERTTPGEDFTWRIRVLHPDRAIERCRVLYNKTPLVLVGRPGHPPECTIEAGGGENALVPLGLENDEARVAVMDGRRTLRKCRFGEINLSIS